jgi:hypothetical protein
MLRDEHLCSFHYASLTALPRVFHSAPNDLRLELREQPGNGVRWRRSELLAIV